MQYVGNWTLHSYFLYSTTIIYSIDRRRMVDCWKAEIEIYRVDFFQANRVWFCVPSSLSPSFSMMKTVECWSKTIRVALIHSHSHPRPQDIAYEKGATSFTKVWMDLFFWRTFTRTSIINECIRKKQREFFQSQISMIVYVSMEWIHFVHLECHI
jgi:hypothetical protein